MPKGIAFHYDGPDQTSPIKYLTHFDKSILDNTAIFSDDMNDDSKEGRDLGEGKVAFLGVEVITPK